MDDKRRQLLKAGLLGTGALAFGSPLQLSQAKNLVSFNGKSLRILILGGTGFLGPHMVREALKRGHDVTLFNRGRTNNALFPDLETLIGDRNNGLDALHGHSWDVVIDNSGYVPRHVRDSARLLAPVTSHYIYTSTVSAYASLAEPLNEDAPLAKIADESIEKVTPDTYGPLKALCEKKVAEEFGEERLSILRPTYVAGPGDHTDRYTYWLARTLLGGEMVWPGTPEDMIQIIDVRDLAKFTIDVADKNIIGKYNTVTPAGTFTMGDLLNDSLAVTGADMVPVWVDYEFIQAQGNIDEGAFPIWIPPISEYAGAALVSGERSVAKGLWNRPTRETARDTVAWWRTLPSERTENMRAGLGLELETELLNRRHETSEK